MNNGYRQDAVIPAHLVASFAAVVLVLFFAASLAVRPVTLDVYPRIGAAPSPLRITMRVPRHEDNRVLRVETDGGDYVRTSAFEIEGEHAPTVFRVEWRDVPAGDYDVIASVYSATALRGIDKVQVTVR